MITFFVRAKRPHSYSIESIVENLQKNTPNSRIVNVPHNQANFFSVLANCWIVFRNQTSVNHVTGDIHYVIPFLSTRNLNILTIHDCGMLENEGENWIKKAVKKWLWFNLPLKYADWVTVISPSTKSKLSDLTNFKSDKVVIIPNPIDEDFLNQAAVQKKNNLNKVFKLVFIGSTPNKNLERCLEAIKDLPVHLEIVGDIPVSSMEILKSYNISFHQWINLSKKELIHIYLGADALLFPSTYEGFGLPIIESQALGLTVITSNIEPMKWVAGVGCAVYVNPFEVESIKKGILSILRDYEYRKSLVEKSFHNLKRFDFKLIVNQYHIIYQYEKNI